MSKPTIRTAHSKKERVQSVPVGPSKTQQSFEKETNINNKVQRHLSGPGKYQGLHTIGNPNAQRQMFYGVMPAESYHDMLNRITDVDNMFRSLPSRTRSQFRNPYQLLRWIEDPANYQKAVKLGLVQDQEVLDAIADAEAAKAAEDDKKLLESLGQGNLLKSDEEAQPPYKRQQPPNPA